MVSFYSVITVRILGYTLLASSFFRVADQIERIDTAGGKMRREGMRKERGKGIRASDDTPNKSRPC